MSNKPKLEHENAERILNISWQLFQQKGYKGVSVDEICAQCELTKPTLYYYFHDKEDLFITVLCRQLSIFEGVINQPGTIENRLANFAGAVFENFQSEYSILMRDREHIQKKENQVALRDAFRKSFFNPLLSLMQTGLDSHELQGYSAEMLTLAFLGIVNNFINRETKLGLTNETLAKEVTHLFLKGALQK